MLSVNLTAPQLLQSAKRYWVWIVLGLCAIYGYIAFTRQNASFATRMSELDLANKTQIAEILAAREEEQKEYRQNVAVLQQTIAKIEKDYALELAKLNADKKKKTEEYVKKYTGKPELLAQKLSSLTNIPVYEGSK